MTKSSNASSSDRASRNRQGASTWNASSHWPVPSYERLIPGTLALFVGVGGNLLVPVLLGRAVDGSHRSPIPSIIDRMALARARLVLRVGRGDRASVVPVHGGGRASGGRAAQRSLRGVGQSGSWILRPAAHRELTNRLASDTTVIQNAVTVNVSMALRFGLSIVGSLGVCSGTRGSSRC